MTSPNESNSGGTDDFVPSTDDLSVCDCDENTFKLRADTPPFPKPATAQPSVKSNKPTLLLAPPRGESPLDPYKKEGSTTGSSLLIDGM